MERIIVTSKLIGALAFVLSSSSAFALSGDFGNAKPPQQSTAVSPLVLTRAGGGGHMGGGFSGGGHSFGGSHGLGFSGGHGFHHGHFRGFGDFSGPYYDDSYGCWWSTRYHRRVCD